MKKILFCVVGRTSSGKSEIAKEIAKRHNLKILKSYTTRKPRPAEIEKGLENADHIFISDTEYDALEPVAPLTLNNARYCTTKQDVMDSDMYIVDPSGLQTLRSAVDHDVRIVEFYIYAEPTIRKERYTKRGGTETAFSSRENNEHSLFTNYENENRYDIIIYNNGELMDAINVMDEYVSMILESRKTLAAYLQSAEQAESTTEPQAVPTAAGDEPNVSEEETNDSTEIEPEVTEPVTAETAEAPEVSTTPEICESSEVSETDAVETLADVPETPEASSVPEPFGNTEETGESFSDDSEMPKEPEKPESSKTPGSSASPLDAFDLDDSEIEDDKGDEDDTSDHRDSTSSESTDDPTDHNSVSPLDAFDLEEDEQDDDVKGYINWIKEGEAEKNNPVALTQNDTDDNPDEPGEPDEPDDLILYID